jgi:hypothetical protein
MNIVSALLRSIPAVEQRADVSADELADLLSSRQTATGRTVSTDTALRQATVFACVRLIAESGAMIPLLLYRRLPVGKARATVANALRALALPEDVLVQVADVPDARRYLSAQAAPSAAQLERLGRQDAHLAGLVVAEFVVLNHRQGQVAGQVVQQLAGAVGGEVVGDDEMVDAFGDGVPQNRFGDICLVAHHRNPDDHVLSLR